MKPLDKKLIDRVDNMLQIDVTQLMQMIPREEAAKDLEAPAAKAGAFVDVHGPFGIGQAEGITAGAGEHDWIVDRTREESDDTFLTLNPINNKITGAAAKSEMVKSKLPNSVLGKIWKLADVDKDGMLDKDEWALSKYLIKLKLEGSEIPNVLPDHLIPPSKRKLYPEINSNNSDTTSLRED